jgi:uncharacterized caspase-like protein
MRAAKLFWAGLLVLLALFVPASAYADKRIALLVGNGAYANVAKLPNPANDVATMKAAFEAAGFDTVDTALDLGRDAFVRQLREFEAKVADADIAVIYYSGHGIEMNGQNFLVPVDALLANDRDVKDEAVPLDRVMSALDSVKKLKLVILDACRNNPFVPKMNVAAGARAVNRGLARVEPQGADTMIAFAAKAGTTASDGEGANSPFAAALAKRLFEPGLDIRLALGNVRDDVLTATGRQQEPFAYGSLGGGTISLTRQASAPVAAPVAAPAASPAAAPANACADAAAHWSMALKFDKLQFYKSHLDKFGSCAFAEFAEAKIAELEAAEKSEAPAAEQGADQAAEKTTDKTAETETTTAGPFVGLVVATLEKDVLPLVGLKKEEGVMVAAVKADSPAAKADIQVGDVLQHFDGKPVGDIDEFPKLVAATPVGTTVTVDLFRNKERLQVSLEVVENANSGETQQASTTSPKRIFTHGFEDKTEVTNILTRLDGGTWQETAASDADAIVATLHPVSESDEEFVLFDASRFMFIRVNLKEKQTYYRAGTTDEWEKLYEITGTE